VLTKELIIWGVAVVQWKSERKVKEKLKDPRFAPQSRQTLKDNVLFI
jgi:hypothetical protein